MVSKKDFQKISKYLWEIPKSFRDNMRVPARIYASEKTFKKIFEDRSISQLINTSALPGVVNYVLGMPDMHEGYGAPIGGVGAMDASKGVISPGFVGYDENCLSPGTKVLNEHGAYFLIKNLEKSKENNKVKHIQFKDKSFISSEIFNFFKRYNNPTIYKIITTCGNEIKATGDHPLRTRQGMKKIKNLENSKSVLIYPFKGVEYEKPSSELILTKKDFKRILKKLRRNNTQGNAVSQILKHLNSRSLLPVKFDSSSLPPLLKLMGFIFGDGAISLGKENKNSQINFYAQPKDLKEIQKDIKKLGFKAPKIYSRRRDYSFTNSYDKTYKFSRTEYSLVKGCRSLAYLLVALGVPYGFKSYSSYRVPKWIFKCPLWQKRLFLASFFGAELSTPSTLNKYNFYAPQLNMQKAKTLEKNAKMFLKDITRLLKEFKIETSEVQNVPGYKYKGKKGKTVGFRLHINGNAENIVRFFETVGYEYNSKKQKEACLAANYLRWKLKVVNFRTEVRKAVQKFYKKRGDFKRFLKEHKEYMTKYTPIQFLFHSLFKENSWGVRKRRGTPRIASNFPSFEEYKEKFSYGRKGLVWDEIEEIVEEPYKDFVYDFTVDHPDHNFVANSFVVSNCGVRLLKSEHKEKEIKSHLKKLATEIQNQVPSGLGKGRKIKLSIKQINKILEGGVPALVKAGYGEKEDIENCEEKGKMEKAAADAVSSRAKKRGRDQVGTLGSGNHFIEIQKVEQIFDKRAAEVFDLKENQVVVMIHTGSRGFGHQNCTDYLKVARKAVSKYKIELPDKQLACMPFDSPEGKRFFGALSAACNYAWANRHMIMVYTRKAFQKVLGEKVKLKLLYDVAHNIAKIEEHEIKGEKKKLIVHRKGATRALPPNHSKIPEKYREIGQPVLIPGSMGTSSYVCVGTEKAKDAFFTVNHGAGRTMSRTAARKKARGEKTVKELKERGIIVKCHSMRGIAEEASYAYKDIDNVIEVVQKAGLSRKVAKLVPLAVIKGE